MLNKVQLIGFLGKDPELRQTQNNLVCNFSVACTERYKGKDGSPKEVTEWVNVVVWGKVAEYCEKYLKKGSACFVEGKFKTRKWQDANGVDKYTTEVVVDMGGKVLFLDKKSDAKPAQNNLPNDMPFNDDIPF